MIELDNHKSDKTMICDETKINIDFQTRSLTFGKYIGESPLIRRAKCALSLKDKIELQNKSRPVAAKKLAP